MDRKETESFKTRINPEVIAVSLLWDMYTFMENPSEIEKLFKRIENNQATDYDKYVAKIMKKRLKSLNSNEMDYIQNILEKV